MFPVVVTWKLFSLHTMQISVDYAMRMSLIIVTVGIASANSSRYACISRREVEHAMWCKPLPSVPSSRGSQAELRNVQKLVLHDFPSLTLPTRNNLQQPLCLPLNISLSRTTNLTPLTATPHNTLATTMAIPDNVYVVTDTTGVIEVCTVKAMAEATAEKHSGSDVETHKLM